jgi:hypothetical protein
MKFLLAVVTASILLVPAVGLAQALDNGGSGTGQYPLVNGGSGVGGTSVGPAGQYEVKNPLGVGSFCGLIKALLRAVIAIGIPIAVLFIVYAGFKFVIAQGKPDKLREARQNLMYTFIGIAIFLGAWLLAMVIANTVNELGKGTGQGQVISCQ